MAHSVTVTLNHAEIASLLTDRAWQIGRRVHRFAQAHAPRETGRLAGSIFVVVRYSPGTVYAEIGTNVKYGLYQHEGTGIYAGRGYIRPKTGKYMRFKPGRPTGPLPQGVGHKSRGARPWVYAKKVKGVPPNPFLTQALTDVVGPVARIRRGRARGRRG